MIWLGATIPEKNTIVRQYCSDHDIQHVVMLSPKKLQFILDTHHECIEWAEIIQYKFFYRLLQEIRDTTLVIINECLRVQDRSDLTYNCIRHFLNQTHHQIIFQHLPIIDTVQDFMILLDFDTKSRYKRQSFRPEMIAECDIHIRPVDFRFDVEIIPARECTKNLYAKKREQLFSGLGSKDPHTLPRNLYLIGGKDKLKHIATGCSYVGRNNRFSLDDIHTYKDMAFPHSPYTVFEYPHNVIDFSTFSTLANQTRFTVLSTDLPVDAWYNERFTTWNERIRSAYTTLQY